MNADEPSAARNPSGATAVGTAPASPASDAALVQACRDGEARAWERLVLRFERLIYTVPRRAGLGSDDAADVFQTVFMRLHQQLHALTQPERVQAWLVTTARRETLHLLRQRKRTTSLDGADGDRETFEPIDPDPLPEELLETLQLQHRVRTALPQLGEPCRSLLETLYGQDEPPSYAAVAAQLGMAIGSIGPTRARCLARLRALLEASP